MSDKKLVQVLSAVDPDEVKLDRTIKRILANKPILSRIIKAAVEECVDMSFEEIEACMEGEVLIECVPMEPGLTNTIQGNATEDAEIGEGCVYYDIRTYLRLPGAASSQQIKILLNVEAQKDDTPGYDLTERAIYYGCRMISSQLNVEFTNRSDDPVKYRNIKKIYSIWLCTESAEKRSNRIVRYKMKRENIFAPDGKCVDDKQRYDLMQVVMIYISKNHTGHDSENSLIRMLTDLFNDEMGASEKIAMLENEHHLLLADPIKKEVTDMCEYTTAIAEKNRQKGRAEGRAEGRAKLIESMLQDGKKPEDIATFCNIALEEVRRVEENMLVHS